VWLDSDDGYELLDVADGTDEFEEVLDRFYNNGFRKAVLRVQRVQNKALWYDFDSTRKRIHQEVCVAGVCKLSLPNLCVCARATARCVLKPLRHFACVL
jgi:hypothetical protein